jgi:predicted RNA binding protein YcfA (HicA-like mRNA interferase family)
MPPVPVLRPRDVVGAFRKLGWEVARQRASHIILTKPGHPATLSVPDHPQVAREALRALINRAGLTVEEFLAAVEAQSKLRRHPSADGYLRATRFIVSTRPLTPTALPLFPLPRGERRGERVTG